MAARTRRVKLDENWRHKIRVSMLLERLQKHALGKVEMSATQIKATEVLLRKSMPDLSSTEVTGDITHRMAESISEEHARQVAEDFIESVRCGADTGSKEPGRVHNDLSA